MSKFALAASLEEIVLKDTSGRCRKLQLCDESDLVYWICTKVGSKPLVLGEEDKRVSNSTLKG
jgi:hypothetical protein